MQNARLLAVIFAATAVGCSSSSSDSNGSNDVPPQQACNDAEKAVCEKLAACSPTLIDYAYGSIDKCKQRIALQCPSIFSVPSTSTTPAKFEGCSKAIPSLDCAALIADFDRTLRSTAACTPDPGGLADGKACGDDSQCKSTSCITDPTTGCGTCGPVTKAGDACVHGACSKGSGLVCAGGKCVTPVAAGGSCSDAAPCANGSECVKGTCQTRGGTVGAKCEVQFDASRPRQQYSDCDLGQGLGCKLADLTSPIGTCQKITEVQTGGACKFTDLKLCVAGGNCTDYVRGGTCAAPAADGAPCDATKAIGCLAPASCVNGVCKVFDPASCK